MKPLVLIWEIKGSVKGLFNIYDPILDFCYWVTSVSYIYWQAALVKNDVVLFAARFTSHSLQEHTEWLPFNQCQFEWQKYIDLAVYQFQWTSYKNYSRKFQMKYLYFSWIHTFSLLNRCYTILLCIKLLHLINLISSHQYKYVCFWEGMFFSTS